MSTEGAADPQAHERQAHERQAHERQAHQRQAHQRQWFIVGRWQEYAGEWRANVLRFVAVGVFYGVQMVHFHLLATDPEAERSFHRAATALAAAWISLALAIVICLRRGFLPPLLKFVSTACDLVLLTALAMLGNGPTSPLVMGYFLIIAVSGLRFSLPLVRCATLAAMGGYLATIGWRDKVWFDSEHVVPPVTQLLTLASLGLTGIIVGQVLRRSGQLAEEYARRVLALERGSE